VEGSPLAARDREALSGAEMCALAASFPSTSSFSQRPWDPDALDQWAAAIWEDLSESFDPTLAEEAEADGVSTLPTYMVGLTTARFLLQVWDPHRRWKCGSLSLSQALLCIWDTAHREAFLAWARRPRCP